MRRYSSTLQKFPLLLPSVSPANVWPIDPRKRFATRAARAYPRADRASTLVLTPYVATSFVGFKRLRDGVNF